MSKPMSFAQLMESLSKKKFNETEIRGTLRLCREWYGGNPSRDGEIARRIAELGDAYLRGWPDPSATGASGDELQAHHDEMRTQATIRAYLMAMMTALMLTGADLSREVDDDEENV